MQSIIILECIYYYFQGKLMQRMIELATVSTVGKSVFSVGKIKQKYVFFKNNLMVCFKIRNS